MAGLSSSATINVSTLAAYEAPSGTPIPVITAAELAAWDFDAPTYGTGNVFTQLGHTSDGTDVTITSEVTGGDTLASRQRAALRRTPVRASYGIGIAALQFDNTVLSMYFGGGDTSQADAFYLPKTFQVAERSILLVMADAEANFAMGFTKTEVQPEGEIAFGPSALSELGLSISILDDDAATSLGAFFRAGLGTPAP